ncbi:MAG: thiolase family protein [Bacteriovoracaceae bacterium]|nr:thiolase family protein [Bacteriovoracaceae bacterium]
MAKSHSSTRNKVYLVSGKRTPFGKFGGSFKDIAPVDLAITAAKHAISDTKLPLDSFDHVIFGNVIPSTTDTIYGGRHLALKLGMPIKTPGYNVNRLCGSGIQVVLDAVRLIKLGEADVVLAAGAENMSLIPQLMYGGRFGTKYGSLKTVDMLLDTLTDKFTGDPMALTAEKLASDYKISRESCDQFSYFSHYKAAKAYGDNLLQAEIAPVEMRGGTCDKDEHVRFNPDISSLETLRSSFISNGVVTPGTASGVVDGACALVVASEGAVERYGLNPIAEIVDGHVVGVEPSEMGIGPVPAIKNLLTKQGLSIGDIDCFEINEAFAGQALACTSELGLSPEELNRWGGAIAIGHPLGATGSRLILTLARQLSYYKENLGVASACIGGGQGISILLKRV